TAAEAAWVSGAGPGPQAVVLERSESYACYTRSGECAPAARYGGLRKRRREFGCDGGRRAELPGRSGVGCLAADTPRHRFGAGAHSSRRRGGAGGERCPEPRVGKE